MTYNASYLIVVTKTEAIIYSLDLYGEGKLISGKVCGIALNASIVEEGIVKNNRPLFNQYFTCAMCILVKEDASNPNNIAKDNLEPSSPGNKEKETEQTQGLKGITLGSTQGLSQMQETKKNTESDIKKRIALMLYLGDSRGFLHAYKLEGA